MSEDRETRDITRMLDRRGLGDGDVVELRFFGGLGETDAAEVPGISVTTLQRDWDFAKTWLAAQLA